MTEREQLKVGCFYWVIPCFDVDFEPPGFEDNGEGYSDARHAASVAYWSQNEQPARFDGFNDKGEDRWIFLGGVDVAEDWPVVWIGEEIKR